MSLPLLHNKICITRRGLDFINEQASDLQQISNHNHSELSSSRLTQMLRNGSLPSLYSTMTTPSKVEIGNHLSLMSLKLKRLNQQGLRKMILTQQDREVKSSMEKHLSEDKHGKYVKGIVDILVRKTREKGKVGNIQSRIERGRAYIDRIEQDYERMYIFKVKEKRGSAKLKKKL